MATTSDSGGSGGGAGNATVNLKTYLDKYARIHLSVAALGTFKVVESFTTDDGTTWVKFKETASAAFANGTASRLNVVDITDTILHHGHKFDFTDTSASTNNFDYSVGVHNVEYGT